MELLAYVLKVNIAIILLYGFFRLFFRQDTFFQCKRVLLLSIFLVALLYPFVDLIPELYRNEKLTQIVTDGLNIPFFHLNEVVVTAEGTQLEPGSIMELITTWKNTFLQVLVGVYICGVCFFGCWLQVQLAGIFFRIYTSRSSRLLEKQVYISSVITAPFSFFRWIVLDTRKYNENEMREILLHEKTHVRQWHSLDMLVCELMCVCCWFNPFVWLMKREIRMNLEYLADRKVIDSGCDIQHYQFHLLRLSYQKTAVKLTNNFNVSPLKKRIQMMNKTQTSWLGLTKYALFVPLVAVLLLFSNIQAMSSSSEKPLEEMKPEISQALPQDSVYTRTQILPQFPGGEKALLEYLYKNMVYPQGAIENKIQGRVILRFIVRKTGKIENVEVVRSLDPACDKESIRVVNVMPDWVPGKQGGKDVDVYYTLPMEFKLLRGDTPK